MASKGTGEGEKCDVTICRGSTASAQTFAIRVGGVLRIGRGVANDVVLDFEGVSVYHAEIHLQPRATGDTGPPLLCVRDESKNGTAVRAGPHAEEATAEAWEPLKKGALRILQHGWQIMMPLNSRKNSKQLPVGDRLVTVFVGSTVPEGFETTATQALALRTHKVFSAGYAILHRNIKPRGVATRGKEAAPPPPEEFSGEFEEAPEPPPLPRGVEEEELEEVEASIVGDQTEYGDEEMTQQRQKKTKKDKKKKDKKEKKRKRIEDQEGELREKKSKKDKKNKKQKDASDEEAEDEEEGEDDEDDDDKTRAERDEMTRLERELEDELAEETARKARRGHATTDGDGITDRDGITVDGITDKDGAESSMAVATEVAGDDGKSVVTHTQKVDDSEPESNQEDEIKAAWGRALKTHPPTLVGSEAAQSSAVPGASTGADAATVADVAEVPAVVEVIGSEGAGIFLRCGVHDKKPTYRRLKDDETPTYLYFRLGADDRTSTGWCVGGKPGKTSDSECQELWKTESYLPATDKGDRGATMQVRAQLDGPALEALAALPDKLRTQVRAAFTAACSGTPIDLPEDGDVPMKGVPEQEEAEAVAMDAMSAQEGERRRAQAQAESADKNAGEADKASEEKPSRPAAEEQSGAHSTEKEAAAAEAETAERRKDAAGTSEETPAGAGAPAAAAEAISEDAAAGAARMLGRQLEAIAEEAGGEQQELPKASEEPAKEDGQGKDLEEAEGASVDAGASVGPAPEAAAGAAAEEPQPEAAQDDDAADNESLPSRGESLPSRASLTTGPGKTVPGGDRGESMAPTNIGERPDSSVDGDDGGKARTRDRPKESGLASLTADALARHTEALARAQAEAYAATFATAKTNYAKSVAGMSIAGRSIAGRSVAGNSIAGRSIAGKSVAGRSVAGRSIAASGVAPTEKTFRTHVTTREMLVGPSQMREIMRSVSPISEPGVMLKRRRRRLLRDVSPCSVESIRSQKKKKKKEKKKDKANKRAVSLHPRQPSPSHYAAASPTPWQPEGSATPFERRSEFSVAPSHWQRDASAPPPSEAVERKKKGKKPKEAKDGKRKGKKKAQEQMGSGLREASETAEPPRPKKKRTQR
eukprot:TRINITY_DN72094_c0_g1_i1.p1 TRINITY_DN72094_c0_g1~~TRINITY_DN72094_c0_g1_i1.p1  ORF type:complete len:1106 (-),score=302.48 TRINITY_DN72094_c0_g1_i1:209-3526(-)